MNIDKAVLDELIRISDNLDKVEKTVASIDVSIRGDEARGVTGMKQHIQVLQRDLEQHTANDEKEFNDIKTLISRTGGIIVGASIVIGAVWTIITFVAKG